MQADAPPASLLPHRERDRHERPPGPLEIYGDGVVEPERASRRPGGGGWGEGACEKAELKGLARRSPLLAAAIAVAMISLTGIPPTMGFFGKFQVFAAAIRADHVTLALIGVILSVLSAYYYLHVIEVMYFAEPEGEAPDDWPWLVAELRESMARLLVITSAVVVIGPAAFLIL